LTRWRPAAAEVGSWAGVTFAPTPADQGRPGPTATAEADRLWRTLQRLPDLHLVVGLDGSARYASSHHARRAGGQVEGAGATVIRLRAPALQTPTVLVELLRRWAGSFWAGQWLSEHEFGHWDGLRLRRRLRRGAPDQPPAAD
jgi:hypothetical protein